MKAVNISWKSAIKAFSLHVLQQNETLKHHINDDSFHKKQNHKTFLQIFRLGFVDFEAHERKSKSGVNEKAHEIFILTCHCCFSSVQLRHLFEAVKLTAKSFFLGQFFFASYAYFDLIVDNK